MRYESRRIKSLPEELRPRERLKKLGPENLSDEELLAVILRTGSKDKDVITLAKELTSLGWKNLEKMSYKELSAIKGLGEVKALQIKALIELSRRIRNPYGKTEILHPEDAYKVVKDRFSDHKETLVALYLDLSHRLMDLEVIAVGSLNRVFSQPKDILRRAVELSAYGILVAHNHPQGRAEPSKADIDFTRRLKEACRILGVELIDHIIVDEEGFVSLRERDLI